MHTPRSQALLASLLTLGALSAQDAVRLRDAVTTLASRDLLGRETGQPGCDRAAAWVAEQFRLAGLTTVPGGLGATAYHHLYTLNALAAPTLSSLTLGSTPLEARLLQTQGVLPSAPSRFLGHGRASELRRQNLAGAWAVVLEGHPGFMEPDAEADPEATLAAKLRAAREAGAAGLVLITADHPKGRGPAYWNRVTPCRIFQPGLEDRDLLSFPLVVIHPEGGRLLHADLLSMPHHAPASLGPLAAATEPIPHALAASQPANILAQIPGTDPVLKDQVILVTAHYDHIGGTATTYYPGADDNASGTAGLVELARLMAGSAPKRTVVFAAFSGEEKGLLGSQAFVTKPPIALSRIVAEVNLDMIGRNGARTLYLTPAAVSGQVSTLVSKARDLARGFDLDLNKGIDQYWQQSDHYPFAQKGIPSIFFNTGLHADLHQPTDTPDKCDFVKMAKVVSLVQAFVGYWANTAEKPAAVASTTYNAWAWPVKGSAPGALAFTTQPQPATVAPGQSVTFRAAVSGGKAPYAWQWLRNGSPMAGATGDTWTFTAQAADQGARIQARVTDSASPAQTVSSTEALLTVQANPQPVLQNGGFENGTTGWTGTTAAIGTWTGEAPFEGTRFARLGGKGRTVTETLSQTFSLPAALTSATLTFQLRIATKETGSTVYDKLAVQVRDSAGTLLKTLATYSNAQATTGYVLRSLDLTPYKGRTLRLDFALTEDASLATAFAVDQVAIALR